MSGAAVKAGLQAEFILPIGQVKAWLETARPGQSLIYCHAAQPIYGETWAEVGRLARAGQVHPTNPRSETCPGFRAFQITVLAAAAEADAAKKQLIPDDLDDDASEQILRILKRAANFGRRCPTNPELAAAAGLSTPAQVAWRLSKLITRGALRLATVKDGPEAGWRTAIFPDGKQTLAAPSARGIAAVSEGVGNG